MYIRTWKKSVRVDVPSADHLQARTNTSSICLPSQIQSVVPGCALSCIQNFVLQNYETSSCSLMTDINFLCTTSTKSGLTIGDGNLQCVISCCPTADLETESGYNVCNGVMGALANTAGTITATISDISTPFASHASPTSISSASLTTNSSESVTSVTVNTIYSVTSTTTTFVTTTVSNNPSVGSILSSPAFVTSESAATSTSISTSESFSFSSATVTSSTASISSLTASSSSSASSASSASDSTGAPTPSVVQQPGLSTAGIVAIAAGSILVGALFIAFIAYLFCVKKRRKARRNHQRLSAFSPGGEHHKITDFESPVDRPFPSSAEVLARQYHPTEIDQGSGNSWWQQNKVTDYDVGVAVTSQPQHYAKPQGAVFGWRPFPTPEHHPSWPAASYVQAPGPANQRDKEEDRWSRATSFDEGVEGQDQELPALAHPARTRSSSRSQSSNTIDMPAPLRIDPSKANNSPANKVQLTPTYDNGNYEPLAVPATIMPIRAMRPARSSSNQAPNFSRPEPLAIRSPPRSPISNFGPTTAVMSSARPVALQSHRKSSTQTNQTLSVHTEIEEDTTPEHEDHKELRLMQPPPYKFPKTPLRDLRYPPIPRSSTIKRQAETPHSPRALLDSRFVNITPTRYAPTQTRDVLVQQRKSFLRTNTSSLSDTDIKTQSSTSPVFPTPPNRTSTRHPSTILTRTISNAIQKAAAPVTTVHVPIPDPFIDNTRAQRPGPPDRHPAKIFPPPRKSSLAHARSRSHASRPPFVRRDQDQPYTQRSHIANALSTLPSSRTADIYGRVNKNQQ